MKRIKRFLGIVFLLGLLGYLVGPKPPKPELNKDLPSISASIANVESFIEKKEDTFSIKPDNESRIVWANANKKERTDYCVLYLHGFSASWYEGYPANVRFAKAFGCNLYLPRLHNHGLETEEALLDMTPDKLWESAKEALMVARTIGKKVLVMGTSTGGTLALKLAADFPEYVDGLILFSPNIRINDKWAFLLSKPWGLQVGRRNIGGKYQLTRTDLDSKDCQYWYCKYRIEALVYLQQLVDASMRKETFSQVVAPVFLGYYYKDKNNQDNVVRVDAMQKMFDQLGTSIDKKIQKAFPGAGHHVIGCEHTSGDIDSVIAETLKFGQDVLGLQMN